MTQETKLHSPAALAFKDIVAGSLGGMAQCITGHPLDTVKVRLQTQPDVTPLKYRGTLQTFQVIIKEEGASAVFKGVQSPLVGMTLMNSVLFLTYGQTKAMFKKSPDDELTIPQLWLCGTIVGFAVGFVESPVDLFKSQLQAQYGERRLYSGFVDCAKKIVTAHGVRGMYQGLSATLARDIPANACYFGIYEMFKRGMTAPGQKTSDLSPLKIMFAGGMGGIGYWGITFPLDVIKSSMQTDSTIKAERQYSGFVDCAKQIFRRRGIRGFYKGFTPCILRSFPSNAACFLVVEKVSKLMGFT